MPETIITERHRQFARLVALGQQSATQCWIQAGFSPTGANAGASRALARVSIKDLVAAEKQKLAEAASSPDSLLSPEFIARRTAELAQQTDNPAAAVSALRLGADMMGLLGGGKQELPEGVDHLLKALARGLQGETVQRTVPAIEARLVDAESDS